MVRFHNFLFWHILYWEVINLQRRQWLNSEQPPPPQAFCHLALNSPSLPAGYLGVVFKASFQRLRFINAGKVHHPSAFYFTNTWLPAGTSCTEIPHEECLMELWDMRWTSAACLKKSSSSKGISYILSHPRYLGKRSGYLKQELSNDLPT